MKRSVIIPTVKTLRCIDQTLQSLAALQDCPEEVIVVQNGLSERDRRDDRANYDRVAQQYDCLHLKIVYDEVPGLLSGRHRGADESSGELLVFIDDDITVAPGWMTALSSVFADPEVVLAGGPSLPEFAAEPPEWLHRCWQPTPDGGRQMAQLSLLELNTNSVTTIHPDFVWGLNYAIRRSALRQYGGFHPDCVPKSMQHFQGDGETGLSHKIAAAGHRAVYHPDALVWHHIGAQRMTPEYFDQRSFYQGVCDSYTQIRQGEDPVEKVPRKISIARRWASYWKRTLLPPKELDEMQARFHRVYRRGFDFHQAAVRSSPVLLRWVRRENYFDYAYPTLESDG
ncbi:glycosyltransferase [Allorhodopirellula solitaria]|uniref:Glycosyl transferase family 2 n=1 Tax=Allorhodopirellula solitaria TaxID=2527987 RepID=A0A5C5XP44_9BACT|nr:glycosyltransferase family 2 protein [Allorhodopirellula solitaria]TWT64674.1 Glycosyl transferase family 2 [Allorhodopirellula solitaria]